MQKKPQSFFDDNDYFHIGTTPAGWRVAAKILDTKTALSGYLTSNTFLHLSFSNWNFMSFLDFILINQIQRFKLFCLSQTAFLSQTQNLISTPQKQFIIQKILTKFEKHSCQRFINSSRPMSKLHYIIKVDWYPYHHLDLDRSLELND